MVAKLYGFTMLYALRQVDWVLSSESIFKLYPFIIKRAPGVPVLNVHTVKNLITPPPIMDGGLILY